MKKLIIIFSIVILFILPFSCDECGDDHSVQVYNHSFSVNSGEYYILDIQTNPSEWTFGDYYYRPEHAQLYQIDNESATYKFYYRADSLYTGPDYVEFWLYLTGGTIEQRHSIQITITDGSQE